MEKRTKKERFAPLAINLAVVAGLGGAGEVLKGKAAEADRKGRKFLGGVYNAVGSACIYATALSIFTLPFTAVNACVSEKYTDAEMTEILNEEAIEV